MTMSDDQLEAALAAHTAELANCTGCATASTTSRRHTARELCSAHRRRMPSIEETNAAIAAQRLAEEPMTVGDACALCGDPEHRAGHRMTGGWGSCLPPDLAEKVMSGTLSPCKAAAWRDARQAHEDKLADDALANETTRAVEIAFRRLSNPAQEVDPDPAVALGHAAMARARLRQRVRQCPECRAIRVFDAGGTCPKHC